MTRPLILDLLPATPGSRITSVWTADPNGRGAHHHAYAWLGPDGAWHVTADVTIDPADITEFTAHTGDITTTYTEGADTNEWTAIIKRDEARR